MKDLIRRILERAAEDGGEEWLKKCLAEMEAEPALVAEEDGEVVGPSDAFQQPLLPQTPSLPYRCSRTQPPERSLAVSAAREDEVSSLGGTSDTTPQRSSLRIQKKKRTASPSPVRVTTGRGRGRQSPVRGRRDLFSLQVPMEEQTASPVARQTQLDNVTAPQRLEFLSRPASSSQRNDSSASQAGAGTSSGELANQLIFKQLLESVNKLQNVISSQSQLSPANVWSAQALPTISQSVSGVNDSIFDSFLNNPTSSQIPEISFKEPLPCEISPLGFHLTTNIKEKIWKGDFIELLTLLPGKEFSGKSDNKKDELSEDRRRTAPKSFYNWLQAFCIYSAILDEKFPDKCSGLFQHLENILEAYRNFGGFGWYNYDESFRQKMSECTAHL